MTVSSVYCNETNCSSFEFQKGKLQKLFNQLRASQNDFKVIPQDIPGSLPGSLFFRDWPLLFLGDDTAIARTSAPNILLVVPACKRELLIICNVHYLLDSSFFLKFHLPVMAVWKSTVYLTSPCLGLKHRGGWFFSRRAFFSDTYWLLWNTGRVYL